MSVGTEAAKAHGGTQRAGQTIVGWEQDLPEERPRGLQASGATGSDQIRAFFFRPVDPEACSPRGPFPRHGNSLTRSWFRPKSAIGGMPGIWQTLRTRSVGGTDWKFGFE